MKRHHLVWQMIKIHVDHGPFFLGVVANYPRIILVKEGLKNVPQHDDLALGGMVNTWIHPVPAVYDPESWYWDNPEAHNV
jgi:peptide/nickel transport system substrate-binding protein